MILQMGLARTPALCNEGIIPIASYTKTGIKENAGDNDPPNTFSYSQLQHACVH